MIESNLNPRWIDIDLEDLFSSKLRIKILKKLAHHGELNISALVKETASNHTEIIKNLAILKEKELIEEKFFGRIHMLRLRKETLVGKVISDFFSYFR
jgi:predicted transcriptional regulator